MKRVFGFGCLALIGVIVLLVVVLVIGSQAPPQTAEEVAALEAKRSAARTELNACAATDEHGSLPYETVFREHPAHVGKMVCFKGEIIQVQDEGNDRYTFRINVTEGEYETWSDTVYATWEGQRFLEDDLVEFAGEVVGLKSYTSVLGGRITIPEIELLAVRRLP